MCLAIPGKIIEITNSDELLRAGRVSFGGVIKEVNLAYVPEAGIDDYVIVHAGFAISTLDEKEALQVFEYLKEIERLGEIEGGSG
jgi:hydrogenase expression/formation protein HypC